MNHVKRKGSSCGVKRIKSICDERGGRTKPYGSSRTRICIEAPRFLLAGTEIYCRGSRKQQWMESIVEDLIKGHLWYTPTLEQNKELYQPDFCRQWQSAARNIANLTWGSYRKSLAPHSEITRSSHISAVSISWDKINVTHREYLVNLSEKDWLWTYSVRCKLGARFRDIVSTGKGTSK